jgi:hypothetical protein
MRFVKPCGKPARFLDSFGKVARLRSVKVSLAFPQKENIERKHGDQETSKSRSTGD